MAADNIISLQFTTVRLNHSWLKRYELDSRKELGEEIISLLSF